MQAWGEIHYPFPLTAQQISDYELKAAPDNPPVRQRGCKKHKASHSR